MDHDHRGWECPKCGTVYAPTVTSCSCLKKECKCGGNCRCKVNEDKDVDSRRLLQEKDDSSRWDAIRR